MAKCGDRGHRNKAGDPCDQTIGEAAAGCCWHTRSPEERRALALKGGLQAMAAAGVSHPEPGRRYMSIEAVDALVDTTINELRAGKRRPATANAILSAVDRKLKVAELTLLARALGVGVAELEGIAS